MRAYCAFSSLSFVVYCFPAHWINCGWLRQMGAVDIAGCGPVHVVGGTAALVAAWFLGPREGRVLHILSALMLRTWMHLLSNVSMGQVLGEEVKIAGQYGVFF